MLKQSASIDQRNDGILAVCQSSRPALLRFLIARGASAPEAEDLVQEVMLKLAEQPTGPVSDPKAYLYKMANNLFIDRRRSAVQRVRREEQWSGVATEINPEADPQCSIETVLIDRERLKFVTDALALLPARTVDILRRYRIDGEPQKHIADAHGISVSAVEKHLQRAYRVIIDARAQLDVENATVQRLSVRKTSNDA